MEASDAFKSIMIVVTGGLSIIISVLVFQIMLMTIANTSSGINFNIFRFALHLGGWLVILLAICLVGQVLRDEVL